LRHSGVDPSKRRHRRWIRAGAWPALAGAVLFANAAFGAGTELVRMLPVPGKPLASYDIGWVDPSRHHYYLSDRTNAGVDIFDTRTDTFVGRVTGFAGFTGSNDTSGPDGMTADGNFIYAGNGDSTLKVIDLRTMQIVNSVNTGGTRRVDEMALDTAGQRLLVVNNADEPAFMTLISTKKGNPIIFSHIVVPGATGGLEQPAWDQKTKRFYISVPELNGDSSQSGVAVFNPKTGLVERIFNVGSCSPSGIALGPMQHLLLGCAQPPSLVINAINGNVVASIPQVGGSDEVWFDPGNDMYYLAARDNPTGPVLGVVDAETNAWIENVPTSPNSHSVAADPRSNQVYVPLTAGTTSPCTSGCIGVYEDTSD
jgi:WD40 repeat protein